MIPMVLRVAVYTAKNPQRCEKGRFHFGTSAKCLFGTPGARHILTSPSINNTRIFRTLNRLHIHTTTKSSWFLFLSAISTSATVFAHLFRNAWRKGKVYRWKGRKG